MSILVTGGHGFLGKHLQLALENRGMKPLYVPTRNTLDLLDKEAVIDHLKGDDIDTVIHLAAKVGGIGANKATPVPMWRDNLLMGINVLEACVQNKVKRLIMAGSTCSYPHTPAEIPFQEDDIFNGYPEPTNAPYGIAKRCLIAGSWAYMDSFDIEIYNPVFANLYGPGDNFDLDTSHAIPALIRKLHTAVVEKKDRCYLWGTGKATRDFLYVTDAAAALVDMAMLPMADGPGPDIIELMNPVNIGTGIETSIKEIALEIARLVGYKGKIIFDSGHPDGQPRRALNTEKAAYRDVLGWNAFVGLEEGLRKTVDYYMEEYVNGKG